MAVTPLPKPRDGAPRNHQMPPSNALLAGQLQRYVDAQLDLQRAQTNQTLQAEAGSPFSRHMARKRELDAQNAVKAARTAMTAPAAAPAPAAPAPVPDPVVAAPTAPTAPATGVPPPPVAVTDPASEISPEEQNARLRARILLMNAGSRAGRLIQTSSSQLGFRTLTGL